MAKERKKLEEELSSAEKDKIKYETELKNLEETMNNTNNREQKKILEDYIGRINNKIRDIKVIICGIENKLKTNGLDK